MTDIQLELWQWLTRQGPKTILDVITATNTNVELFFSQVKNMRHRLEKTTSRKIDEKKIAQPLCEMERIHELRMDRMRKVKKAKSKKKALAIERQYYTIKSLRKKGASWNEIVEYLTRYHRLNVTRQYLYSVMTELTQKYEEKK